MWPLEIKIIKLGSCTLDPGNAAADLLVSLKNALGVGGGATIAVIRQGGDILLVDPGYEGEGDLSPENREKNWRVLKALLSFEGIAPEQVTKVFLTHDHWDHCGNLEGFPGVAWYCHKEALKGLPEAWRGKFLGVAEGEELLPRTTVLHTPGHTPGHASVLWTDPDRRFKIALCGDAVINLAWLLAGKIWRWNPDFAGEKAARASIRKLLQAADLLIPGHGQPFFATARLRNSW